MGQLFEMPEQAYESGDLLQRLLEGYPNLLTTDGQSGLLLKREASLPPEEGGC